MQLHRCISFRYARCTLHGRKARDGGIEPQDGEWWMHPEDGRTVWVHAWTGDDVKPVQDCKLTN